MLMIEFVNHIELLARITEKVWRISAARRLTAHCLTRRNVSTPFKCLLRYLVRPPTPTPHLAISERIRFPKRKHPWLLSSKIPRNLKA